MKFHLLAACIVTMAITSGCVQSLSPLYMPGAFTFREELLGEWTDEDEEVRIRIERHGDEQRYLVTLLEFPEREGERPPAVLQPQQLLVTLVPLGKDLFVNIESTPQPREAESEPALLTLPVHFIAKIALRRDEIALSQLCDRWLRETLKDDPGSLPCVRLGRRGVMPLDASEGFLNIGAHLLITASTEDLRAFVQSHADDPEAWSEPAVFRRRSATQDAPAMDPTDDR